jgi:acetyl-CoA carboxylase biotin carboxyl carrier protein
MGESNDIFDVRRVRRLVELMIEHELTEIDLRQADQRIRLKKGGDQVITMAPAAAAHALPAAAPSAPAASSAPAAAKVDDASIVTIKSPMVGTFYAAASPESPPFVKVGDHISAKSVVCVIEAMKVFNEIAAEVSGQVVAVLVDNGEAVEFNRPLFKIDTKK